MSNNIFTPLPVDLAKGPGGPISMDPQPWEVMEVLTEAWERFKANPIPLLVAFVVVTGLGFMVSMVISVPMNILGTILTESMENRDVGMILGFGLQMTSSVVSNMISIAFQIGMLKLGLMVARGEPVDTSMITSAYGRFLTFFGVFFLNALLVMVGALLLFVPGMIIGVGLMFATMFAIDTEMGVVDCLRASWKYTNGHKLSLVGLGFAMAGIALVAVLFTCGFGFLVVAPVMQLAMAIVYTRISGRLRSELPDPLLD